MTPYGNTTDFASYMAAAGYSVPSGDQTSALLRGSMSLDAQYNPRWIGEQAAYPQDRAWPRVNAYWPSGAPVVGIPDQVVMAAYEMSYQELVSPGSTSPTVTTGKVARRKRVEGAVEVEYARDWANDGDLVRSMTPVNTKIEGMLWGLIGELSPLPGVLVV